MECFTKLSDHTSIYLTIPLTFYLTLFSNLFDYSNYLKIKLKKNQTDSHKCTPLVTSDLNKEKILISLFSSTKVTEAATVLFENQPPPAAPTNRPLHQIQLELNQSGLVLNQSTNLLVNDSRQQQRWVIEQLAIEN